MFARTQHPAVFKIVKLFLKQYFNDGKQLSAASQHLTLERREKPRRKFTWKGFVFSAG